MVPAPRTLADCGLCIAVPLWENERVVPQADSLSGSLCDAAAGLNSPTAQEARCGPCGRASPHTRPCPGARAAAYQSEGRVRRSSGGSRGASRAVTRGPIASVCGPVTASVLPEELRSDEEAFPDLNNVWGRSVRAGN